MISRDTLNKSGEIQTCMIQASKKPQKIRAILYNWKTADPIEAGFSVNKRAKRVENKYD